MIKRLTGYIKGSAQEVRKVNWPTGPEVRQKTVMVLLFSAIITAILGGFDFLFNRAVIGFITNNQQSAPTQDFLGDAEGSAFDPEAIEIEVGDEEGLTPVEDVEVETVPVDEE